MHVIIRELCFIADLGNALIIQGGRINKGNHKNIYRRRMVRSELPLDPKGLNWFGCEADHIQHGSHGAMMG